MKYNFKYISDSYWKFFENELTYIRYEIVLDIGYSCIQNKIIQHRFNVKFYSL